MRLKEPSDLAAVIAPSAKDALKDADAAIVAAEWPDFRDLAAEDFRTLMVRPLVLDQSRFLASQLSGNVGLEYVTTGRAT